CEILRRSKIQRAFVQAASQDSAFDAFVFDLAQRFDVFQVGDAARGDDGYVDVARQIDGCFDVDAGEHAVAPDIRVDDGFAAIVFEFMGQVQHVVARKFAPAVCGHLAVAGVQADDDIAGKGAAGVAQKARILDGRSADDDVRQASV